MCNENDLKVFVRWRHPASGDDEWVLERHLGLAEATAGLPGREESFFQQGTMIATANTKYVVLTPILPRPDETWFFSVELDTVRVERTKYNGEVYPYEIPWPPVLRDMSAGGDDDIVCHVV
jgi:hypothetical protein